VKQQTQDETALDERAEWANTITHGIGVVASLVAIPVLVVLTVRNSSAAGVVGAVVFSSGLLLLYLASTMYHAARSPTLRARLKVLDHSAIYVLIAASYTPFTIAVLGPGWGWSLFGVIWGLAAAGVVFKLFFTGRFNLASTLLYIAMGWLVLIAVVPLAHAVKPAALAWLVAGGVAYTAGTPFYHATRFRYGHAIWHLFVLAGSVCHTIAVALQLA